MKHDPYEWSLQYMPKRRGWGHKVYRDLVSGKVSIADWSGGTPSTTEDGPLWVPFGAICEAQCANNRLHYHVPLIGRHGKIAATFTEIGTIAALVECNDCKLTLDAELKRAVGLAAYIATGDVER